MTVRPLTPDDAPAWWHLRLEALQTDPLAFGKSPEEHRSTTIADAASRIRGFTPGSFILGAFAQDDLIANATLIREPNLKERHKAHLYGVYVAASHRGQRVGQLLLQSLIGIARSVDSLEQLQLAVHTGNHAALRLYRSLGFETFGTEPHALKLGDTYVDEHHMILRLH